MLALLGLHKIGCGLSVQDGDLVAVAVRLRQDGAEVLGRTRLPAFRDRPPSEWGGRYSTFAKEAGLDGHPVTLCLPRAESVFRVLRLPANGSADLHQAIAPHAAELHPYGELEIVHAAAEVEPAVAVEGRRPVAVAVAQADGVRRYAELFRKAGIALNRITVPAGALRAAVRRDVDRGGQPLALVARSGGDAEIYAESEREGCVSWGIDAEALPDGAALLLLREALSAEGDPPVRLGVLGGVDTGQLPDGIDSRDPEDVLLPRSGLRDALTLPQDLLAFGAAVEAARPRSGLGLNLLPAGLREPRSVGRSARRLVLAGALALAAGSCLALPVLHDRSYADRLRRETAALRQAEASAGAVRAPADNVSRRSAWLLQRQGRAGSDLQLLRALARALPDGSRLTAVEIGDEGFAAAGVARDATAVLRSLAASHLLRDARFAGAPSAGPAGESFRIEALRR